MRTFKALCLAAGAVVVAGTSAHAADMVNGGKLLLTQGVTNIEGASGGGLATWATIAGYETRDGIGANAHATYVDLSDYSLRDYGAAVGLWDRVEVSYTRQEFDTGGTGAKLGLGKDFTFDQDVYGAKVRILGNLVYDQDTWVPQIAAGVQYKRNDQDAIVHAVGAKSDQGVDYYVAATKLFLDQSVLVDATLRYTRANQTGLLGFGGDRKDGYSPEFEGSVAYLLTRQIVIGGEYRTKPDNLGFAKEEGAWDLFGAYAFSKHLSLTAAYVDLGDIATFKNQHGLYVSLQAGF